MKTLIVLFILVSNTAFAGDANSNNRRVNNTFLSPETREVLGIESNNQINSVDHADWTEATGGLWAGGRQCDRSGAGEVLGVSGGCGVFNTLNDMEKQEFVQEVAPIADRLAESYLFTDLARKSHRNAKCAQATMRRVQDSDDMKGEIEATLERRWAEIEPQLNFIKAEIESLDRQITGGSYIPRYCSEMYTPSQDCRDRMAAARRVPGLNLRKNEMKSLRNMLLNTLPFGQEPKFRQMYLKRAKGQHPGLPSMAALPSINTYFRKAVRETLSGANKRVRHFDNKMRMEEPFPYRLNDFDKRSLIKQNYYALMDQYEGQSEMTDGLMCRAHARYIEGPEKISMAADVALLGVSVMTLGSTAVISGLARAGVQVGRVAMTGARAASIARTAGTALNIGLIAADATYATVNTFDSCREAFRAPYFNDNACQLDAEGNPVINVDLPSFQESQGSINKCIFDAAVTAMPLSVAGLTVKQMSNIRVLRRGTITLSRGEDVINVSIRGTLNGLEETTKAVDRVSDAGSRIRNLGSLDDLDEARRAALNSFSNNHPLRSSMREVLEQSNSLEEMALAVENLYQDAFEAMLRSGDDQLIRKARNGILDRAFAQDFNQYISANAIGRTSDALSISGAILNNDFGTAGSAASDFNAPVVPNRAPASISY